MRGQISRKLRKVIDLWRSTTHEGERQAARARGEALAKAAGMTFEEAAKSASVAASGGNPFVGFDDWMEAKEPGWKAARAAERKDREDARTARRAALIARFGSLAAVLEPCERERAILAAVARWRAACEPSHARWTHDLDGLSDG